MVTRRLGGLVLILSTLGVTGGPGLGCRSRDRPGSVLTKKVINRQFRRYFPGRQTPTPDTDVVAPLVSCILRTTDTNDGTLRLKLEIVENADAIGNYCSDPDSSVTNESCSKTYGTGGCFRIRKRDDEQSARLSVTKADPGALTGTFVGIELELDSADPINPRLFPTVLSRDTAYRKMEKLLKKAVAAV